MYALINTMPAVDCYVGRVVSMHRTEKAAQLADRKLQKLTRGANGSNSYLPTMIAPLKVRRAAGDMIERCEVAAA